MGSGFYSYKTASMRRVSLYEEQEITRIFVNKSMPKSMDPSGVVRECCENAEHPEVMPIIIGLDVTGSMGHIPANLIKNDFPEVMKKILDEGIPCPQLCFTAYGDYTCDSAPLQVGQFEASDELMEKWLTSIYLEGGGGGNEGESTSLVHYFAAFHTSCDAITKRGEKGLIVTIGDEPNLRFYPKSALREIFGGAQVDMTAEEILEAAQKNWEVYHINVLDYSGRLKGTKDNWKKLLGDHYIEVDSNSDTNVSNVIACLAIEHYQRIKGNLASKQQER
ncbi:MAG: hypothetical protein J6Y37_12780 [Paludibacteraceae bacterium]|nr:hypothetical protein [Paludibacteraceae bacterium]